MSKKLHQVTPARLITLGIIYFRATRYNFLLTTLRVKNRSNLFNDEGPTIR